MCSHQHHQQHDRIGVGDGSTGATGMTVSRTIRDLMLYSYPRSMIELASTPGGLKMALPVTETTSGLVRRPTSDDRGGNGVGERDESQGI